MTHWTWRRILFGIVALIIAVVCSVVGGLDAAIILLAFVAMFAASASVALYVIWGIAGIVIFVWLSKKGYEIVNEAPM